MSVGQIVPGQQAMWNLLEKLGEGDAGEVYLVESTLGGKQAILKRPRKNAFSSDILRQAAQIRTEGNILKALSGVAFSDQETRISTPALLDQSTQGDGVGERFFIVIGRAAGFDLKSLQRRLHFGLLDGLESPTETENRFFLQKLSGLGEIPEPILIRALSGVLHLLETIHSCQVWNDDVMQYGLIWNDVKPEHLYWNPVDASLTIIDWGNGQFLGPDGATKDRRFSRNDDDVQFLQEMGAFLAEASPNLYKRLDWPQDVPAGNAYSLGIKPIKERLVPLHEDVLKRLKALREDETDLCQTTRPKPGQLSKSEDLQKRIVTFGEMPDIPSAVNLHSRVLLQMAAAKDLEAFQKVCGQTAQLAASSMEKWTLLGEIADIALQQSKTQGDSARSAFSNALAAGVADDWPEALWELAEFVENEPLPAWWESLSRGMRQLHLKLDQDALTPYIVVSRTFYTFQATVLQMGDKTLQPSSSGEDEALNQLQTYEHLLKIFNEDVVKKWKDFDPSPPYAGIDYDEFDRIATDIEVMLPGTEDKFAKTLTQPRAQARLVLDAWDRKDFDLARRALRMLLLWDPERRRLLLADRAIGATTQWLSRVYQGARKDEPFYDYITTIELAGRRLRNQVGPAKWLDTILDTFKRLRKGAKHADLLIEHPEILREIPWLNEYRSRELLSLPRTHPLKLERDEAASQPVSLVAGVVEGKLGVQQDVHLQEPLDTWAPEARGSSARVFAGTLLNRRGLPSPYAIKVMRPDRVEYALPLFREEAQVLTMLRDVPGVTPMVECGFLRIEDGLEFPSDDSHASAAHLHGQVVRYGVEEVQNYLVSMDRFLAQGWLPYLGLVKRDQEHNLMRYCDAGYTHGWFLPLRESLLLTIQICDILQCAHDRNVVYRDHKILHYYWDPGSHGVVMIDWNIAKRQPQGLSDAERQFDLVQLGARAFHHILTGRPAPGALSQGPNRPEDIEASASTYAVSWTYDDERLPNRVKEILEQILTRGYTHIRDLRQDLVELYEQIPAAVQGGG